MAPDELPQPLDVAAQFVARVEKDLLAQPGVQHHHPVPHGHGVNQRFTRLAAELLAEHVDQIEVVARAQQFLVPGVEVVVPADQRPDDLGERLDTRVRQLLVP